MSDFIIRSRDELVQKAPLIKSQMVEALQSGPLKVSIVKPSKSRIQERKYHAMIRDICRTGTIKINGLIVDTSDGDVVKALLVVWYELELNDLGETLRKPSRYFVDPKTGEKIKIRPSTKDFSVKEGAGFIEFLYSLGVEFSVMWSNEVKGYEEYPEFKG